VSARRAAHSLRACMSRPLLTAEPAEMGNAPQGAVGGARDTPSMGVAVVVARRI
jgi:hypothetical protein